MKHIEKTKIMEIIKFKDTEQYLEYFKLDKPKINQQLKSKLSIGYNLNIITSSLSIGDIIPGTYRKIINIELCELSLIDNHKYKVMSDLNCTHAFLYTTEPTLDILDLMKSDILDAVFSIFSSRYSFVNITKDDLIEVYEPGVKGLPELYDYNVKDRKLYPTRYTGSNKQILLADFEEYCKKIQLIHDKWNN